MTNDDKEYASAYDSGYVNALLQLKVQINEWIDKPNSQVLQVFDVINYLIRMDKTHNE